ncbi:hypothetical protein Pvag_1202 [Pantoea vagans C9-1]|nr:hypothetical protein Pvag_1202 [Pantoea vagans C9-1]
MRSGGVTPFFQRSTTCWLHPAWCGELAHCDCAQINPSLADNSFIFSDMSLRTCLKILK